MIYLLQSHWVTVLSTDWRREGGIILYGPERIELVGRRG